MSQFPKDFIEQEWNEFCCIDGYSECFDYFGQDYITSLWNHLLLNFECRLKRYFHLNADHHHHDLGDENEKDRGRLLYYILYRCLGGWDEEEQVYKSRAEEDYVFKKKPDPDPEAIAWCDGLVIELEDSLGCDLPLCSSASATFKSAPDKTSCFDSTHASQKSCIKRNANPSPSFPNAICGVDT